MVDQTLIKRVRERLQQAYDHHSKNDNMHEALLKDHRHISEQEKWFADGIASSIEICDDILKEEDK